MSSKDLNECSGCLIISNDENISLPSNGKINAYDINFDKPCFFVNNHYMTPLKKSYSVVLPNPISLDYKDKFRINIKLPKNIFSEKYGYSLDSLAKELKNNENFTASLRIKSSDKCININRCASNSDELEIEDYCGWINIIIHYQVGKIVDQNEICNLCEISYCLCFDAIKLRSLYGSCHGGSNEVAEFKSETCLEIENVEARRFAEITDGGATGITIEGPEKFLCLTVETSSTAPAVTVNFDKFSSTLKVVLPNTGTTAILNLDTALSALTGDWSATGSPVSNASAVVGTEKTNYVLIV